MLLLILFLLLFSTAGCASPSRASRLDLIALGPAGVFQKAGEVAGRALPMRVTGTLQVKFNGGSLTGQGVILFAEPDSIRFDVTAFLGTTVLQAVLTGDGAQIYLPNEKALLEGAFDERAVIRIGGYPFHLASVREWVLGPAISRDWRRLADNVDRFDFGVKEITLGMAEPGGYRIVATLSRDLFYRRVEFYDPEGVLLWESEYDDYRRLKGSYLPGTVTVRYPSAGLEIVYSVMRRKANPDRSPGDFRLNLPADVTRFALRPDPVRPPPP